MIRTARGRRPFLVLMRETMIKSTVLCVCGAISAVRICVRISAQERADGLPDLFCQNPYMEKALISRRSRL